jgi:hypothetical protein
MTWLCAARQFMGHGCASTPLMARDLILLDELAQLFERGVHILRTLECKRAIIEECRAVPQAVFAPIFDDR